MQAYLVSLSVNDLWSHRFVVEDGFYIIQIILYRDQRLAQSVSRQHHDKSLPALAGVSQLHVSLSPLGALMLRKGRRLPSANDTAANKAAINNSPCTLEISMTEIKIIILLVLVCTRTRTHDQLFIYKLDVMHVHARLIAWAVGIFKFVIQSLRMVTQ